MYVPALMIVGFKSQHRQQECFRLVFIVVWNYIINQNGASCPNIYHNY